MRDTSYINRNEGNDQESIQLPNTFRQRQQRERRTHLEQRHYNKTPQAESQKDSFFPNLSVQPLFEDECSVHCICTRNRTKLQTCVWICDLNYMLLLENTHYLIEMRLMTAQVLQNVISLVVDLK